MSLSWAPPTDFGLGEGVPYPLLGYEVAVRSYPQDPQGGGAEAVASFQVDGAATSVSVPPLRGLSAADTALFSLPSWGTRQVWQP